MSLGLMNIEKEIYFVFDNFIANIDANNLQESDFLLDVG